MKKIFIFIVFMLCSQISFASESSNDFHTTLLINAEHHTKYYMNITGPKGFKTIDSRQPFYQGEDPGLVFFPEHEEAKSHTKRFAIMAGVGLRDTASRLIVTAERNLNTHEKGFKVIERIDNKNRNFDEKILIGTYQKGESKWIAYTQLWSGPQDVTGVVYNGAIPGSMSEKEAIQEVRNFIKETVRVLEIKEIP